MCLYLRDCVFVYCLRNIFSYDVKPFPSAVDICDTLFVTNYFVTAMDRSFSENRFNTFLIKNIK